MTLEYESKVRAKHIKQRLPVEELDIALDLLKTVAVTLTIVLFYLLH